jgi:hypothetical protein
MANNKVCGPATDFTLVKEEGTRTVISYDLQEEAGKELTTWREIYFPKKQVAKPTIEMVKDAIKGDIDSQTDETILCGFVWNEKPVYLSSENQFNFKAAYDLAVQTDGANLPVTFKLGELSDGTPVYHTFEEMAEAQDFYVKAVTFINQTLAAGWQRKDSIDWDAYAAALDPEYTPKKKTTKK